MRPNLNLLNVKHPGPVCKQEEAPSHFRHVPSGQVVTSEKVAGVEPGIFQRSGPALTLLLTSSRKWLTSLDHQVEKCLYRPIHRPFPVNGCIAEPCQNRLRMLLKT